MDCESCRWFEDASEYFDAQHPDDLDELVDGSNLASEPSEYGFCKRHAPRPHDGNHIADVMWPLVFKNEWCGEFAKSDQEAMDGTHAG